MNPKARLLAFYLPQFHPIPENDRWWGPGFTEWTNVAKARPLYRGHAQPRLPRDLGFYDLRVPEVRQAQAELAAGCGVEGFCYWHYWFGHGRRILERPFQEVLRTGKPDFPFSLAWANQSWTGIWHGDPKTKLLAQEYPGKADEAAHFEWARAAFEDPRYQTVDGKPIFVVFSPQDHPRLAAFIDHWRELAHKAGYPGLYFVGLTNRYDKRVDRYRNPILDPFDGVTPHGPHVFLEDLPRSLTAKAVRRLRARRLGGLVERLAGDRLRLPARHAYADFVAHGLHDLPDEPRFLPGVMPGWDNTPRSGHRGVVLEDPSPALFERHLAQAVERVAGRPEQHRLVFLKAWNEWAEGNYVEPDALSGSGYLDAVRGVMLPPAAGRDGPRHEGTSI